MRAIVLRLPHSTDKIDLSAEEEKNARKSEGKRCRNVVIFVDFLQSDKY